MNGGRLVAVNKSRYFKKGSSLCLGTGAFVSGLEYSADCKAEVVGKPSKRFFELGWYQFAKCSTNLLQYLFSCLQIYWKRAYGRDSHDWWRCPWRRVGFVCIRNISWNLHFAPQEPRRRGCWAGWSGPASTGRATRTSGGRNLILFSMI